MKRVVASYVGANKFFERSYLDGRLELELAPQGSLAEKLRCGGSGIPAFYTRTGVGPIVERGGLPIKYRQRTAEGDLTAPVLDDSGKPFSRRPKPFSKELEPEIVAQPRPVEMFGGVPYLKEESIITDFAFVKAWKGDTLGNLVYRSTARNFNPIVAKAGRITIAEVEHLVQPGEIAPDDVHTPGIYVNRIIQGERYDKPIEVLRFSDDVKEGESFLDFFPCRISYPVRS